MPAPRRDRVARTRADRKTQKSVRILDRLAGAVITIGGIGTIAAVLLVAVFLTWVAAPMFFPRELDEGPVIATGGADTEVLAIGFDEYRTIAWSMQRDGRVLFHDADSGRELEEARPFGERAPTAWAFPPGEDQAAFGFENGDLVLLHIGFALRFLDDEPAELADLTAGQRRTFEGGIVERTPTGQLRQLVPAFDVEDPVAWSPGSTLRLVDLSTTPSGEVLVGHSDDGLLRIRSARRTKNLMTGKTTVKLRGGELDLVGHAPPIALHLASLGNMLMYVEPNGHLVRIDTRDLAHPAVVEELETTAGAKVTHTAFLLGKSSLAIGDEHGQIGVWFPTKPADATAADGIRFVAGHHFASGGPAVAKLGASARTRLLAASYDDGSVELFHVTSERLVGSAPATGEPVGALTILPKDDALAVLRDGAVRVFEIDAAHPDVTLASMFEPVWYEGYEAPAHVWQSSSGTDDFEPKFGLLPIVFGSLKATVYSLLIGVPLALLAAIYTSEFLKPRTRARVKPAIESMASLPSVVLGFLAALVVAPFVEGVLPIVLLAMFTVPFSFLFGARLWQLLPRRTALIAENQRPLVYVLTFFAGVILAWLGGHAFEVLLFDGDLRAWLDGHGASAVGGWVLLLTPVMALLALLFHTRLAGPVLRHRVANWERPRLAQLDLVLFSLTTLVVLLLAWLTGVVFDRLGLDARGGLLGTYVQRNALVVGFMMGFAIIPIIYTIAEDALSAVPEHLRAASLGAGATRWQTAVRVIIPTAMSGLFSAVMVGFGRAVGETMIVLMAAGNTPVMDWNLFNGLRTLSANIAVELPEAVRDSTHYRMLFLAALVLFVITFVLNTIAELIRSRFRKRAFQL